MGSHELTAKYRPIPKPLRDRLVGENYVTLRPQIRAA